MVVTSIGYDAPVLCDRSPTLQLKQKLTEDDGLDQLLEMMVEDTHAENPKKRRKKKPPKGDPRTPIEPEDESFSSRS